MRSPSNDVPVRPQPRAALPGARGLVSLAVLSLAGCAAETSDEEAPAVLEDRAQIQERLEGMDDEFRLMNTVAFPSTVADGRLINVWANELAQSVYENVHMDGDETGGRLPVGAMIVRELRQEDGTWVKDTVIVQREEGWNPSTQDMWFSETDENGELREDMSAACFTCHAGRGEHAFLFGVPLQYAR